jgi:nucleoside-diphosphate-sugar epimerase
MPSVNKGSRVLVSGANGYIAMWVVRTLLERGFTVRGTVRTEEKGKFMIEYFESLGYGDKVEVVVVDDIVKVGNWCLSNIPLI